MRVEYFREALSDGYAAWSSAAFLKGKHTASASLTYKTFHFLKVAFSDNTAPLRSASESEDDYDGGDSEGTYSDDAAEVLGVGRRGFKSRAKATPMPRYGWVEEGEHSIFVRAPATEYVRFWFVDLPRFFHEFWLWLLP